MLPPCLYLFAPTTGGAGSMCRGWWLTAGRFLRGRTAGRLFLRRATRGERSCLRRLVAEGTRQALWHVTYCWWRIQWWYSCTH